MKANSFSNKLTISISNLQILKDFTKEKIPKFGFFKIGDCFDQKWGLSSLAKDWCRYVHLFLVSLFWLPWIAFTNFIAINVRIISKK